MKRLLILLTIALTCLSLLTTTAEARRFWGGDNFGKQRSITPRSAQSFMASPPETSRSNKWLGPLAGLAIGAVLITMFAGSGLQERGNMPQVTEVRAINAELLDVATEGDLAIAGVRFTGQLCENKGTPETVDEIRHVQKNLLDQKSVWLLSGIQQTTLH